MEQRLAVLARADTQAVNRRRSAATVWLIACAIVATTPRTADARPKRRDAKAAFDRGLAAYKKANFAAASEALGKSFELERDPDTLFAWAQAERKLEHCDRAIDLYGTMLSFELAAKNREAVERSLADCRAVIAAQQPAVAPAAEPPTPAPRVPPAPVAVIAPPAPPTPRVPPAPIAVVAPPARPPPPPASTRAWYRDPVALELLGAGAVATGIGAGLLISARGRDDDAHHATNIDDARRFGDQARSRGNLGLITAGAGTAFVIAGVVWVVAHRHAGEPSRVAGWLAPGAGGLAVTGAF